MYMRVRVRMRVDEARLFVSRSRSRDVMRCVSRRLPERLSMSRINSGGDLSNVPGWLP